MYEPDDIDMPLSSSSSLPDTQPADSLTQTQSQDVNSQSQPLGIWGQLNPTKKSSNPDGLNAPFMSNYIYFFLLINLFIYLQLV